MTDDLGAPVSYLVLDRGVPVFSSDGERLGRVKRVLAAEDEDIFDGLIVDTREGDRFVDAEHAARLYERGVVLDVRGDEAHHLPDPSAGPATLGVTPGDTVPGDLGDTLRRAWNRISGNY